VGIRNSPSRDRQYLMQAPDRSASLRRFALPSLGFGVGLRRQHYAEVLERRPAMDWFEIISENFMVPGGRPLRILERVRESYPIVMHGVSLSVGSADPLNRNYVRDLAAMVKRFEPAWISDHLCWTGVAGRNLHDLMPLPFTEEVVRHVAQRVREVQEMLGRPLLLENISSYITFKSSRLREWEFLAAVAEEAGCAILLDLNNVHVNAVNNNFDPFRYIDFLPRDRVAQFHLAGHSFHGACLLDTHDHPVCGAVWRLYEYAVARFGEVPTLVEWDDDIPDFADLAAVADLAREHCRSACAQIPAPDENG
jgi:uncharacterized protein (UPF0276 family)